MQGLSIVPLSAMLGARSRRPPASRSPRAPRPSPAAAPARLGAFGVPSAAISTFRSMLLNELTDGTEIDQVLLVREAERRQRRDGGDYLRLQLGDRTGAVACMVWEELARGRRSWRAPGTPVRVRGRYTVHPRFGPQINLRGLEPAAPGSYAIRGPARRPGARGRADGRRDPRAAGHDPGAAPARCCSSACSARSSRAVGGLPRRRRRPSTTTRPTAHGLLEHCLGVAQAVSAISATFAGIDRDVAVTGALLHDIGKLEAYTERAARASTSPTPAGCTARSRSATTASAA